MTERPSIPKPPYDGGCLCGAVRWRLDVRPLAVNACHCHDCKKLSGGTNLLSLTARRDGFSARGETQSWRKRADSGREIDIVRCAQCGTRLWHDPLTAPTLVIIAAGTLDDSSWVVPASHIWIEKASPGVMIQDDAIKVVGQSSREAQIDAFHPLYGDGT